MKEENEVQLTKDVIDRKCKMAKKQSLDSRCKSVEQCVTRGKIDTTYRKNMRQLMSKKARTWMENQFRPNKEKLKGENNIQKGSTKEINFETILYKGKRTQIEIR